MGKWKYRIVEMADGTFRLQYLQSQFLFLKDWQEYGCREYKTSNAAREDMERAIESDKQRLEDWKKQQLAGKVKRVVIEGES